MDEREEAPASGQLPVTNADGVDLTQIRALQAMTYSERVRALVTIVDNLERFKKNARRV